MQVVKINTSQNIAIDYEVAGVGERILARIIDMAILFMVTYIFLIIFVAIDPGIMRGDVPTGIIIIGVILTIINAFYDLLAEMFFKGQSIGKRAMKIKVVAINGARPTFGQFLLRWVFRLVDFVLTLGIGAVLSVAVSEKKQRIGDMVAGTTLIKTNPRMALKDLFFEQFEEGYQPLIAEAVTLKDDEVGLIFEVVKNFRRTGNSRLVYDMAVKLKEHLSVAIPPGMNEFEFLTVVLKDYSYLASFEYNNQ